MAFKIVDLFHGQAPPSIIFVPCLIGILPFLPVCPTLVPLLKYPYPGNNIGSPSNGAFPAGHQWHRKGNCSPGFPEPGQTAKMHPFLHWFGNATAGFERSAVGCCGMY